MLYCIKNADIGEMYLVMLGLSLFGGIFIRKCLSILIIAPMKTSSSFFKPATYAKLMLLSRLCEFCEK